MHQQICDWLGLPAESWPPDHYTLLGLSRGESDLQIIEKKVHERMQRVRPYQLNYPDQVTEALNRLAQAYSCLMDPSTRNAYDESIRVSPPLNAVQGRDQDNGSPDLMSPLAWLFGPWDRLAEEDSASTSALQMPEFQDWKKGVRPPLQKRNPKSSDPKFSRADSAAKESPPGQESKTFSRSAMIWRYSNGIMLVLAVLAFLMALLRQWTR